MSRLPRVTIARVLHWAGTHDIATAWEDGAVTLDPEGRAVLVHALTDQVMVLRTTEEVETDNLPVEDLADAIRQSDTQLWSTRAVLQSREPLPRTPMTVDVTVNVAAGLSDVQLDTALCDALRALQEGRMRTTRAISTIVEERR
ncbi:hypothetical protein I6B53_09280 [Schaalia sp. 19OD2882]|uniref:hypothetical protein n=1 Tax=Schaalia sp. 19OD2882 TaxID=2794089 RepID=UPI001C1EF5E4|nr:hypothetical protein [Schaalia sp. 19OD2882]QWW19280.1 hypothetical protein I6B53_09280 [Schaalia sp. 19OD2882]